MKTLDRYKKSNVRFLKILGMRGVLQIFLLSIALPPLNAQNTLGNSMGTKAPLNGFIENGGQIIDQNNTPNPSVKYFLKGNGLNVELKQNGFSYDTYTTQRIPSLQKDLSPFEERSELNRDSELFHFHRIDVEFDGANYSPEIEVSGKSKASYNFFTTGTTESGISKVYSYQQVIYKYIYPNIDVQFVYDEKSGFKYNFIIHPGGDYHKIKVHYSGTEDVDLLNGEIRLGTSNGYVNENIPSSYLIESAKELQVSYVQEKNIQDEFGFDISGTYNPFETLVIDPTPCLAWGSYLGGSGANEFALAVVADEAGNVFVTGVLNSSSGIATSGSYQTTYGGNQDAYIAKFDPSGDLIWATYYGGNVVDYSYAIALDTSANIYVTGWTSSTINIATSGAYQTAYNAGKDAFVAKFDSTGVNRIWATYYGGSSDDYGSGIAVGKNGNAYIVGSTQSTTGIATSGSYQPGYGGFVDGIIAKFSINGDSLLWGTYFGGINSENNVAVALDDSEYVYVVGNTMSSSGIATSGSYMQSYLGNQDGFIEKFDFSGASRIWGTYFGGTDVDHATSLAVDFNRNVYIAGYTKSSSGIATAGAYQSSLASVQDAFVAKLDSMATGIVWGTYYGGTANDDAWSMSINSTAVFIAGTTSSSNGIATSGAFQNTYHGGNDGYAAKFYLTNGSLIWGSYYGGTGSEWLWGMNVDPLENVYLVGSTSSPNGIATSGAYDTTYAGSSDCFIAKLGCTLTGIEPVNDNQNFYSVFPNPAADQIHVRLNDLTSQDVTYTVTDIAGKVVSTKQIEYLDPESTFDIDIHNWADGIYFLMVKNDLGCFTQKFIKN